jgi:hypothetical protein
MCFQHYRCRIVHAAKQSYEIENLPKHLYHILANKSVVVCPEAAPFFYKEASNMATIMSLTTTGCVVLDSAGEWSLV